MPTPRILLLSRKAITDRNPELLAYLSTVPPVMAVVQSDEDRDAAQQITEVVTTFQQPTAIVADFIGCLVVNDDGSVEPIALPEMSPEAEPEPLIKIVE